MGLLSSIESIFPILVLIALGYVLRGRGMFNDTFSGNLSKFILQIALPAGIFVSVIHHLDIAAIWSLRASFLFVLASFILGYVLACILMKVLNIQQGRKGAFINMVVNDNCLFIGLPVQMALFGEESFPFFLLYYIMNTLSLWMVGIFFIDADYGTRANSRSIIRRLDSLVCRLARHFCGLELIWFGVPVRGMALFAGNPSRRHHR